MSPEQASPSCWLAHWLCISDSDSDPDPQQESNPVTEPLFTPDKQDEDSRMMSSVETKTEDMDIASPLSDGGMHVVEMEDLGTETTTATDV